MASMTRDRNPGRRVAAAVLCAMGALACRRSHLPPRPDGASVVIAPESAPGNGLIVLAEVEPNDLLANAQSLSLATSPVVGVAGHLVSVPGSRAKDVDIYRVIVPPPAVIVAGPDGASSPPRQIMAVSVQPDPALVISIDALDDQGKVLVADVGATPGEVEGIPNLSVMPGTYFVRVKPGSSGSASASGLVPGGSGATSGVTRHEAGISGGSGYQLTIRLLPVEAGDEVEPNGKPRWPVTWLPAVTSPVFWVGGTTRTGSACRWWGCPRAACFRPTWMCRPALPRRWRSMIRSNTR